MDSKKNYPFLINSLTLLSNAVGTVVSIEGKPWRQILREAADAIAELSSPWTHVSTGGNLPLLENHYEDPEGADSYDCSRRVLGRESVDAPVKIVIYLRDSEGKTYWVSDEDEILRIAWWAPLPE